MGIAYAFLAPPVYEANILLQVDDNESSSGLVGDASSLLNVKTPASAESEILQSRAILARSWKESIFTSTRGRTYFPLIGERIAKASSDLSHPGLLGIGGYAWGTESIDVPVFDVPSDLEDVKFRLTFLGNGRFEITQSDLDQPIQGIVGQQIDTAQSVGKIRLLVKDIHANPGTTFNLYQLPTVGDDRKPAKESGYYGEG